MNERMNERMNCPKTS